MIHFADSTQTEALKSIWHLCFDDHKNYIDSYYFNRGDRVRTLIAEQGNKPIAMLDMISVDIKMGAQVFSGSYIYAAATLPEYRNQGWMHKLIDTCCSIAKQEGIGYILLVPQTPSLVQFYQRLDFQQEIYLDENVETIQQTQITAHGSQLRICSEEEFIALKSKYEQQFENTVLHDARLNSLIYRQVLAGGGNVLFDPDLLAYAICWPEKEQLNIQEISVFNDINSTQKFAFACCQYYHQQKFKLRQMGGNTLYGLAKPLKSDLPTLEHIYMNTMLD